MTYLCVRTHVLCESCDKCMFCNHFCQHFPVNNVPYRFPYIILFLDIGLMVLILIPVKILFCIYFFHKYSKRIFKLFDFPFFWLWAHAFQKRVMRSKLDISVLLLLRITKFRITWKHTWCEPWFDPNMPPPDIWPGTNPAPPMWTK